MVFARLHIVLFCFCAQLITAQTSQTGFGGLEFGTSPKQHKNLSLEIWEGETALYSLTRELTVAANKVRDVRLTFTKNKLSVISGVAGKKGREAIIAELQDNFGKLRFSKVKNFEEWQNNKVKIVIEPAHADNIMISVYNKTTG